MPQAGNKIWACMLSCLSPGCVDVLLGRKYRCRDLLLALSFFVVPALGQALGLYPVPIFAALVTLLLACWIAGVTHCVRAPAQALFTDGVHCRVAAVAAICVFWLPLFLSLFLCSKLVVQRAWMGNDTMNPGMERGDVILVDRMAYRFRAPVYGDLVLVEELSDSGVTRHERAFFGRVIACPGDEIQLIGGQPLVNRRRLEQYIRRDANRLAPQTIAYEVPHGVSGSPEPARWYPVLTATQTLGSPTNSVRLDPGIYYVLEDNRSLDREVYGAFVHIREIQGRPQYIVYNTLKKSFSRSGIAIR